MVQEKMEFNNVSYLELWQPFVLWSRTICAISVEASRETILWNYFEFGPLVQEKMLFKDISYLGLAVLLFIGAGPFM